MRHPFRSARVLRKWPLRLGALALVSLVVVAARPPEYYFEIAKNIDIFSRVLREVNAQYVDDVEPNAFVRTGIDAMLGSLDPYTNFISASEIEDFRFMSTGQYGGIGALIEQRGERLLIRQPYKGRPADEAGLRAGDLILKIDDKQVAEEGYDLEDVRNLLRGQPGTKVDVTVQRPGTPKPVAVTITRADVKVDNVPYSGVVAPGVGYISLEGFTQDATQEVRTALKKLEVELDGQETKGIILDLRGNPGGLLMEAVGISNLFVPKGETIVETRGRTEGSVQAFSTSSQPYDTTTRLVVLINGASASASEIVAGVVQDLDRGVVVGRRSFGKGLVQNTVPLSYNTQMKLTTARYYTPSGRCIQAVDYSERGEGVVRTPDSLKQTFKTRKGRPVRDQGGIDPDLEVTERALHAVTQTLLERDVIFDFGTHYQNLYDSLPPPEDFRVTDSLYNAFIAFADTHPEFNYESPITDELERLRVLYEDEAYEATVMPLVDSLYALTTTHAKQDISAHRQEITWFIKRELVSRYHYADGVQRASLEQDPDLEAAINLLQDPEAYNSLLSLKTPQQKEQEQKD